jgi:Kef-type K+ transport system membrane component KefB
VLSSLNQNAAMALIAIGGGAAYAVTGFALVRPQLIRFAASVERDGTLVPGKLTVVLTLLMAAAWFTDWIGVHAVFGAFVLGVAMPRGMLTAELNRQIEPVATALLVPLFFAYSGLSTRAGLLWSAELLLLAAGVTLIASLGKAVACWGAARLTGRPNREAMAIGALMNARGLMELIILNVGLERGLISPTLFTIMVTMTLITTVAAGPLFEWAWRGGREVPELAGVRAH